jgi:hypothetical protein
MKKRLLTIFALATALTLQSGLTPAGVGTDNFALAATVPTTAQENVQSGDQEQIYGDQLMTPQERTTFRTKMSAAKTLEERELIRQENHQAMQERAKAQGLTLPDQPSAGRQGMGQGGGMMNQGGGMGHGGGMGSGRGGSQ